MKISFQSIRYYASRLLSFVRFTALVWNRRWDSFKELVVFTFLVDLNKHK